MSAPITVEERLLTPAAAALNAGVGGRDHAARLDVLEAVASAVGGGDLGVLRADGEGRMLGEAEAARAAQPVLETLTSIPIHPALALTALAREPLDRAQRRAAGAYYTDFRLARFLARQAAQHLPVGGRVIDPASGTGALIVATALEVNNDQEQTDHFIAESVHAADLSAHALRGVRIALSALTADAGTIEALDARLRQIDSLAAGAGPWIDVAPTGFDLVIGNPPWEKLKVTRHEHLAANGESRHYGSDYGDSDLSGLAVAREEMRAYTDQLAGLYQLRGAGEPDMYKVFLALATELAVTGHLAMLVPAGLIRSHGARRLRESLFSRAAELDVTVITNRARLFAIDTRFKFLAVHAAFSSAEPRTKSFQLHHADGGSDGVSVTGSASLDRDELGALRSDLTVPEVRSDGEWELFRRMSRNSLRGQSVEPEQPIVRELDMTRDRRLFRRLAGADALPLIEGRMVHQFRHAMKAHVNGTGRSARWSVNVVGDAVIGPQFVVDRDDLPESLATRVATSRVGFCDITGQTNERSMLAARIPAGVVCGNKVPTIVFDNHDEADLWLAIVNSFAFDWLLRRVLTTSVNYFVLRSVPLPDIHRHGQRATRLIELVRAIDAAYHGRAPGDEQQIAAWRAEADALILASYGLDGRDAELIFADFPLLDRAEPAIREEKRSTITRDLVLQSFSTIAGQPAPLALDRRVAEARDLGAVAYVPADAARSLGASSATITAAA